MKKLFYFLLFAISISTCGNLIENIKLYACGFYEVYNNLKRDYPTAAEKRIGQRDTINYERNNKILYVKKQHNNNDYCYHNDTNKIDTVKKTKCGYRKEVDKDGNTFIVYDDGRIVYMI